MPGRGVSFSRERLLRGLDPSLVEPLRVAEAVAREGAGRVELYLVGGLVRDLLLGRPVKDLDLVVDAVDAVDAVEAPEPGGNGFAAAERFAARLAEALGAGLRRHPAFGTAALTEVPGLAPGAAIDVAATRRETYRHPAALPTVRPAGLEEDVLRRDFTVNTLTLHLPSVPSPAGGQPVLLDPLGGLEDLEARRLRPLHGRSFEDDPTRILRGVRFEVRLGFRLGQEALGQVEEVLARGIFERLSSPRLAAELRKLVEEPGDAPLRGLVRLAELGVLQAFHPALAAVPPPGMDPAAGDQGWQRGWRPVAEAWALAEGEDLSAAARQRLLVGALAAAFAGDGPWEGLEERLLGPGRPQGPSLDDAGPRLDGAWRLVSRESPSPAAHRVAEALETLATEERLVLEARARSGGGEEARRVLAWLERYRRDLAPLELAVRGRDLVEAGIPPGPAVGEALAAVRRERLDGLLGPEDELERAIELARRRPAEEGP